MQATLEQVLSEIRKVSLRLDKWDAYVQDAKTRKAANALRRLNYRIAKRKSEEGRLPLPSGDVLKFRDKQLAPRFQQWADIGRRFAKADQPEAFVTWLVHQWNNCTYLKKPVTFSGSSFRIWNGRFRYAYGPRDLMHFSERKGGFGLLRSPDEYADFRSRPIWDWSAAVLKPVWSLIGPCPKRFDQCCQLLIGAGYTNLEVGNDVWDINEERKVINRMLGKVGIKLQCMLRSVFVGLRVRGESSPVTVPDSISAGDVEFQTHVV